MNGSKDQERAFQVKSIGTVSKKDGRTDIRLSAGYSAAVTSLSDFGHATIIWWADKFEEYRDQIDMVIDLPYAQGERAGLFATRSPVRPNPICISVVELGKVDATKGVLEIDEIDAADGTPVLDIKPYYGTSDRVQDYRQPSWVPADWPEWRIPIPEEDYGS